ncbi:MAG: hypothetical protein KJ077_27495 [Anaerolineae bacterium]|nr:hypothetical protein [Anaerolineae bacterium]
MTNKDDIRKLIREHNRRLQILREQNARFGAHTPPHILTEIEDIQAELERLRLELADLKTSDTFSLFPTTKPPPIRPTQDLGSSNNPLSFRSILAGIIITIVGGIILASIVQEGRFAPTPNLPPPTNTDMPISDTSTATNTPTSTSTSISTTPTKISNLSEVSEICLPNKCQIQGFTGGLLISNHGEIFGLFNSRQWLVEHVSDEEAQALEHFNCTTKSDVDSQVRWGFNVAYCRFQDRGFKLGNPVSEGGSIEGEVFKLTSLGVEVDLKGWYGLGSILIKSDGNWEFLN